MNTWEKLKKVVKPHQIVLLIILIGSNSFAWFIYATKVNNTMDAHVRAWDVLFQSGDSPIVDYVDLNIESMYPGMEDYHYELNAYNKSEVGAVVTYEILSADIMGTKYSTKEGLNDNNETVPENTITSEELINKLKNDYPFKFNFDVSNSVLDAEIGQAKYTIDVNWPFESGDDALDTKWGHLAYNYKNQYPDKPSIKLEIKIFISQVADNTTDDNAN
ncbi:MAG: hypothetical protein ACI4XK_00195 [Bacilli bacterium]